MKNDEIEKLRAQIDAIDARLLELLNERARHAIEIGHTKKKSDKNAIAYRPDREILHLRTLLSDNRGPLPKEAVSMLFQEIISACRALEQKITVVFLGPEGTYTEQAVFKHFGHTISLKACITVEEVFQHIAENRAYYGVVPVENSSEGSVGNTLDCFMENDIKIVGEVELRINHCLLGKQSHLKEVTKVYGHAQSLAQCRNWLSGHLPNSTQINSDSSSQAILQLEDDRNAAAIASAHAAELYQLNILARDIEDHAQNTTRFLILGNQYPEASGRDKTSVLVSTRNKSGTLANLLQILAAEGISLTRIESRPSKRINWEYAFFLDMEGHCEETHISKGLANLQKEADFYKLLGSYPCAIE
ncbi:MAG: prephenate dehydratase [Gammaproteobacteria bacterium]|nr:prephenate dehydratase [Gammaproteobacteria bacterium]